MYTYSIFMYIVPGVRSHRRPRAGEEAGGVRWRIIAHEIAHLQLHPHFISNRIQHVDKQFVEIDIEDESSLEEWSKKFNVSKATLQYRIRNP